MCIDLGSFFIMKLGSNLYKFIEKVVMLPLNVKGGTVFKLLTTGTDKITSTEKLV